MDFLILVSASETDNETKRLYKIIFIYISGDMNMVYFAVHKRKIMGKQIHEGLDKKKKELKRKIKIRENIKEERQAGSSLLEVTKETKRENVEAKYLIPEVTNWIETDAVKKTKEKIKMWLSLRYPVHIIGPTGCGKTIMALQVAKELGRPTVWINGDESITTTDLIGGYSQVETTTVRDKYIHNVFKDKDILKAEWVDNPLTTACKYGYTLIYNEFSRARAVANNVLLSIFSEGILELPTQFSEERYIKVHPDFRVIFTSNSIEYAGIHRAQDALLDRMVGVYMDYYDRETEAKIIASQSGVEEKEAFLIVDILRSLRNKLPNEDWFGTRAGTMVTKALKLTNNFGRENVKELIGDVITSKTKDLEHLRKQTEIIKRL